jgi:hypothetical protein
VRPGSAWRASPVAVALGLGAALALAGCGGSGGAAASTGVGGSTTAGGSTAAGASSAARASTSATRAGTHTTRTSTAAARPVVRGPRIGARQTVRTHGAALTVTVLRVLALPHTGASALPGTRQVGVELRIANESGQTYDSSSSGDVSLVLSAGQAEPLDVRSGACTTPLVDFESMIESGDVRSGCVAFSAPRRARVLGVRFSPHGRTPGTLTWRTG